MRLFVTAFSTLSLALAALAPSPARAAFNFFNPSVRDSIPKLISGTGMYQDIRAQVVSPDLHYFDVNSPLWTDGAAKSRYVAVPPGTSILYNDTADAYVYPDKAMVIKNFAVDTVAGDPRTRILVETRFTALRKNGSLERWYLFTYRWRRDQSDADLVPDTGVSATVTVYNQGLSGPSTAKKWRFPSVPQCAACHRNGAKPGRVVLAFFTAQINRPLAANPSVNQLTHFFDKGLLKTSGARPDLARSPRWTRYDDETATVESRTRSYLAANCSGCHGEAGIRSGATPNVTLDFDFHDMRVRTDLATKRLFGAFPLDSAGLMVPGRPDRSVILFRQETRNTKEGDFSLNKWSMPPLGSYEPDTAALKVMSSWVTGLGPSALRRTAPAGAFGLRVREGRILELAGAPDGETPELLDFRGRKVPLLPLGGGAWRIPGERRHGLHLLVLRGRVAHRLVL